jgi:hypothetical protein
VRLGRSWSKTQFEGYRPVPVESPVESPVDALLLEQASVAAAVQGQAAVELLQVVEQRQLAVQGAGQGQGQAGQ